MYLLLSVAFSESKRELPRIAGAPEDMFVYTLFGYSITFCFLILSCDNVVSNLDHLLRIAVY